MIIDVFLSIESWDFSYGKENDPIEIIKLKINIVCYKYLIPQPTHYPTNVGLDLYSNIFQP